MTWLEKNWKDLIAALLSVLLAYFLLKNVFGGQMSQHVHGMLGEWLRMPWFGRFGGLVLAFLELFAVVVLYTRWRPSGALLACSLMSVAVLIHLLSPLGVTMPRFDGDGNIVGDDGGTKFIMVCIAWNAAVALVVDDWFSFNSQLRAFFARAVQN